MKIYEQFDLDKMIETALNIQSNIKSKIYDFGEIKNIPFDEFEEIYNTEAQDLIKKVCVIDFICEKHQIKLDAVEYMKVFAMKKLPELYALGQVYKAGEPLNGLIDVLAEIQKRGFIKPLLSKNESESENPNH